MLHSALLRPNKQLTLCFFFQMEMRSNQLIKDHELRRRDLMILRYDRQRTLCDEIISRQRQLIEGKSQSATPEYSTHP